MEPAAISVLSQVMSALLIPYLAKLARELGRIDTTMTGAKSDSSGTSLAPMLWDQLRPTLGQRPDVVSAAREAAEDPDDSDAAADFRRKLRRLFIEEPELLVQVSRTLSEMSPSGAVDPAVHDINAAGERAELATARPARRRTTGCTRG
jgi:hypothetical protein